MNKKRPFFNKHEKAFQLLPFLTQLQLNLLSTFILQELQHCKPIFQIPQSKYCFTFTINTLLQLKKLYTIRFFDYGNPAANSTVYSPIY